MDKTATPLKKEKKEKKNRARFARKKGNQKDKNSVRKFSEILKETSTFFSTPWWSEKFENLFIIFLKCFDFENCIECFKNMKTLEKLAFCFRETEQTKETRTTKQNEQTGEILKNVWFLLPRGGLRIVL